jgi:hypothetical protein
VSEYLHGLWALAITIIGFFLQRLITSTDNQFIEMWKQVEKLRIADAEHERKDNEVAMNLLAKNNELANSQARTDEQIRNLMLIFNEVKIDIRSINEKIDKWRNDK